MTPPAGGGDLLSPGARADEAELIEHCKSRLARYKAPTSVEFREELPRTATGKLQKFKLRQPYWKAATARWADSGSARAVTGCR